MWKLLLSSGSMTESGLGRELSQQKCRESQALRRLNRGEVYERRGKGRRKRRGEREEEEEGGENVKEEEKRGLDILYQKRRTYGANLLILL